MGPHSLFSLVRLRETSTLTPPSACCSRSLAEFCYSPRFLSRHLVGARCRCGLFGRRQRGNTLAMHGAIYLLAAAADSGLLQYTARALMQGNRELYLSGGALLYAIAAALCYGLTLPFHKEKAERWTDRVAPALLAAVLCWAVAGLSAGSLAHFNFGAPFASTVHTALISALAILLAWVGRRWNLKETVWLLFPWMIFGAVKLAGEDFQRGRSATLFLSLLVYGRTLIALPRLLKERAG